MVMINHGSSNDYKGDVGDFACYDDYDEECDLVKIFAC